MATDIFLNKIDDAVRRLGSSRSALYAAIRRGELETVLVGSARRIPEDALQDYVRRLRDQNADHDSQD